MWALVETRDGNSIEGRLTSPPLSTAAPLDMGSLIRFHATDAIDILDADHDWHDHRDFLHAMFEGDDAFEEWKKCRDVG